MDNFQKQAEIELLKQKRLLEEQQQIWVSSPEGFLFARNRSHSQTYYHQRKIRDGRSWKTVQTNITNDFLLQNKLLNKKLSEKAIKAYQNNVPLLEKFCSNYQSTDFYDVVAKLPAKYDNLLAQHQLQEMEEWMNAPYKRCPYYPEHVNHRTAYGGYVRSKSEVIIANALYSFGIPFHTDEELFFTGYGEIPYYPDFTILLPNHKFLYWEHWGLLSKEKYRRDNVDKLAAYQANGLVIGENLILTQDDRHGNCRGHVIYDIIEKMVLPHFEGIPLPRRSI